ncbi:MAG: amino acid ABC transporter substrate-binding protein [Desulfobacteraceae bacterium]|nr:amino acid ABC transporter substrate-binding protein [Desulfobacteraceae bacterium]
MKSKFLTMIKSRKQTKILNYLIINTLLIYFLLINPSFAKNTIIVSGHPDYPPISWAENDKLVGAAVEMVQTIFTELNIPMEAKNTGPWKRVQMNARNGLIDVIAAAYINEERKTYMDYTVPFIKDPVVIFVLKDKVFPFEKWDDLIGKTGTTNLGESYGEAFDQFIKTKLSMNRVPNTIKNFELLKLERYHYFVFGLYPGMALASTTGYDQIITTLPNHVEAADFYITFSKKSNLAGLLPQVNKIINRLKADGSIAAWVVKYQNYYKNNTLKVKKSD